MAIDRSMHLSNQSQNILDTSNSIKNFDLYIFDMDGTIVDSIKDIQLSINYMLSIYNQPPLSVETVKSFIGSGLEHLIKQVLPQSDSTLIKQSIQYFRDYYEKHLLDNTILYPYILEILECLKNKNKAILTNKPKYFAEKILNGLGISNHFSTIIGNESNDELKPSPLGVKKILSKFNTNPKKTILIGDSVIDILTARSSGIYSASVGYGYTSPLILKNEKSDFFFNSSYELFKDLSC